MNPFKNRSLDTSRERGESDATHGVQRRPKETHESTRPKRQQRIEAAIKKYATSSESLRTSDDVRSAMKKRGLHAPKAHPGTDLLFRRSVAPKPSGRITIDGMPTNRRNQRAKYKSEVSTVGDKGIRPQTNSENRLSVAALKVPLGSSQINNVAKKSTRSFVTTISDQPGNTEMALTTGSDVRIDKQQNQRRQPKSRSSKYPHPAVGSTPREFLPDRLLPLDFTPKHDPGVAPVRGGVRGRGQNPVRKSDLVMGEGESLEAFKSQTYDILDYDPKGPHENKEALMAAPWARKALTLSKEARALADKLYPDGSDWNSETDAFRHAYWNHRMAQEFGTSLAKRFGDGHERYTNFEPEDQVMDLFNNDIAQRLAIDPANQGRDPVEVIAEAIRDGQLVLSTDEISNRKIGMPPRHLSRKEKVEAYLEEKFK